jgi:hypothetical protein
LETIIGVVLLFEVGVDIVVVDSCLSSGSQESRQAGAQL